jgi:hypothetical protein
MGACLCRRISGCTPAAPVWADSPYDASGLLYSVHPRSLPDLLPMKALGQPFRIRQHSHQCRVATLRSLRCPLRETSQVCCHAHSPLGVGACVTNPLSQYCHPFAPSELPDFSATIGGSDFPTLSTSSSLFRLVRGCATPLALPPGYPWLPCVLNVGLDEV